MADDIETYFGMSLKEIFTWRGLAQRNLSASDGKATRGNLSNKFPRTAIRCADALRAVTPLFSQAGFARAILWSRALQGKGAHDVLEGTLEHLYTDPVLIQDKAIWVLAQVLASAQQQFTSISCVTPTREEMLSGELLSAITSHASNWAEKSEQLLDRANAKLQLGRIDLQIQQREGVTGGDFGLIIEYEKNGKTVFLPLIFQAKRYEGKTADISQFNESRGYQYDTLSKRKCAAAYLFYENGTATINNTIPPLAKLVQDTKSPTVKTHTNVDDDSLDFFSFVIKAVSGGREFPTADDEKAALSMIIETAPLDDLIAIVAIGRSDGTQSRYALAYAAIGNGDDPNHAPPDDEPSQGDKAKFKPG